MTPSRLTPRNFALPKFAAAANELVRDAAIGRDELEARIGELERRIFKHVDDFEFEEAARIRDRIQQLQATMGLRGLSPTLPPGEARLNARRVNG